MTLATTRIHDEWMAVLTDEYNVSDNNAQLLVDSIVGDPRIAFAAPQNEQGITNLRKQVSTIINEFDLTEFGEITSQETVREELVSKFNNYMISEPTGGEESSNAEDTDTGVEDSISVEVTDNEREFAPGAAAGAGAEAPGGDIQPRDDVLSDERAKDSSSTETSTGTDGEQAQNEEEAVDPQDLPLEHEIARVVLRAHEEEIDEELDVPLNLVSTDLVTYAATVISVYEDILAAELFPDRPDHEQKVLFESMMKNRIEKNFQRMRNEES